MEAYGECRGATSIDPALSCVVPADDAENPRCRIPDHLRYIRGDENRYARKERETPAEAVVDPQAARETQPPKATGRASNANEMKKVDAIGCVFLDIGGVVLTDGWDHHARRRAVTHFRLDPAEIEARHHLTWDTHQAGKLTLDEYLDCVVFFRRRSFTRAQFRRLMFAQSGPHAGMLSLIARLKARYGLRIVVVSNEGRELNAYRIRKFKLAAFVDAFVSSCFVHVLKPDPDIFRLALDIAQVEARCVLYIDDAATFIEVAENLGIRGIHHTGYRATCAKLDSFGLPIDEPSHP